MATAVYVLCALTSLACAALLLAAYRRVRKGGCCSGVLSALWPRPRKWRGRSGVTFEFLAGASGLAPGAIALFFLRFRLESRDRLFLIFAIAFATFAVNRVLLSVLDDKGRGTNGRLPRASAHVRAHRTGRPRQEPTARAHARRATSSATVVDLAALTPQVSVRRGARVSDELG